MWESRAEWGRQVGQLRATERKSGRRLLDRDGEGSSRRESDILGSRRVSRSFSFTLLRQLQKVRREGQLAEQHLHPPAIVLNFLRFLLKFKQFSSF